MSEVASTSRTSKVIVWILAVVTTAAVTWFIDNWLNRPQIRIEIISVDFKEESPPGEFSLLAVYGIDEFFDNHDELRARILDQLAPTTQALSDKGTVENMLAQLQMAKRAKGKIALDPADVQTAISKARNGLQLLMGAKNEITQLSFSQNQDVKAYQALFEKQDNNSFLTPFLPERPDKISSLQEWKQLLQQSVTQYEDAYKIIERSINVLSDELKSIAMNTHQKKQLLTVRALLINNGNKPTGLYETGVLRMLASGADNVVLNSSSALEEMVVPAQSHKVVAFGLAKDDRNSPPLLKNAMQRYQSANTECELHVRTLTGTTAISPKFPFYERSAFNEKVITELLKSQ